MTYPVFTRDQLPAPQEGWPEHEAHASDGILKAQPVHGVFGVERPDGTVKKCTEGYGFLMLNADDSLDFLSLSEFEANFKGAEHVRLALELEAKIAELREKVHEISSPQDSPGNPS